MLNNSFINSGMNRNYFSRGISTSDGGSPSIADWFVSSVSGGDSNTGKSPTQAFLTIAKLLTALQAGESAAFARGSHWREGMDIALAGVTFLAYGVGADPILDGSDILANAGFSLTPAQTYTYQIAITFDSPGVNTWLRAWEDDAKLTYQTSVANVEANAGSYYVTSHVAGSATLYVHASDDSDVTSNGKVYEFNKRTSVLDFYDSPNVTVTGIETRRANNNNGSFVAGRGATVSDCTWRDGTKHNALFRQDTTVTDCLAIDAYYGAQGSSMVVVADTSPSGKTVTFTRVDCTNTVYDATVAGFFWEVVSGGTYDAITCTDCDCTNVSTGFSGSAVLVPTLINCTTTGGSIGARANDAYPMYIQGGSYSGSGATIMALNATNAKMVLTDGVDVQSSHVSPITCYGTNNGAAFDISDCTIHLPNGNAVGIYLTGTGVSITNNNNSFPGPGDLILGDIETGAGGDTYVGDNNAYGDSTPRFRWAGAWVDFATWKTNTGQDGNSTAGA